MKMRVFVGYQNINSGAKVATEHILESLRKIAPRSEFIVYNQHPYQYAGIFSFTRNFLWSIWDFKKKVDRVPGKLTAIYSPYYLLYVAVLLSKHRRTPFYFHLHGDQAVTELATHSRSFLSFLSIHYWYTFFVNNVITSLQKHVLRKARKVFFVSRQAKEHFLAQYRVALPDNHTAVISNGISLRKFSPAGVKRRALLRKQLLENSSSWAFLYVGRIDHKKGVLELIQSLSLLQTHRPVSLIVVHPDTPDKYSQRYLNRLKAVAVESLATVSFRKNPANLTEYYQIADLVILPSYQEMMPLVMLEAFACGVPFIGSAVGNMPEILKKIHFQLILKKVNPHTIAQTIQWYLKLSAQKKRSIMSLEREAAKKFSWENSSRKIIQQLAQPVR